MVLNIVPNSCRICLQQSAKLRSIYKPLEEGEEALNVMLQDVTGIVLNEGMGHSMEPHSICRDCELTLNMSYQFRLKALKAQRIIESLLPMEEKNEKPDDEINHSDEVEENNEQNISIEQQETYKSMIVKDEVEYLEDPYQELEVEESAELLETNPQAQDTDNVLSEQEVEEEGEVEEIMELDIEFNEDIKSEEDIVPASDENKRATLKKKNRIHPNKISLVRVKKPKAVTPEDDQEKKHLKRVKDEANHICDICGNTFTQRGRMVEHRRRHNKELIYNCEVCDKSFATTEQLKKHFFSHSGGKPLKCKYCSRTFFYESVRKAHEAVHLGHKPFVCDDCGKAFAYSHTLKKHMLIHKNIKLYRCCHCNKDFRLLHHLKQHLESKSHQIQTQVTTVDEPAT